MKRRRIKLSYRARFTILERDGFRCRYCGRGPEATELEVDHVLPVAAGGTNDPSNLVAACKACNRGKSAIPGVMHPDAILRHREWIDFAAECYENDNYLGFLATDPAIASVCGEIVL